MSVRILFKFVNKVIKKRKKMKDTIEVNWKGEMAFEAAVKEHRILMDAREEAGGHDKGPRPKPLLMVSMAGCTGMDVISILKKMKVDPAEFKLRITGDMTEEHPKFFTSFHMIYEFRGDNLPLDKITRAVELSQDRYCGTIATIRQGVPVTWEIKIL